MKRRVSSLTAPSLDSLVDIVSNNVGILIILCVFMAILSLVSSSSTPSSVDQEDISTIPVKKVRIPWAHESLKKPLLFAVHDNRLVYLDRLAVYQSFYQQVQQQDLVPQVLAFEDYEVQFRSSRCLSFWVREDHGSWFHEMKQSGGDLQRLMKTYEASDVYFFFSVTPDSFELFHEMRQYLWDQKFEVGWQPSTDGEPLLFCGSSPLTGIQPQ